ncbi:MAG: hypothetical protein AAGB04_31420, partial [Pseudomonadota bacterium]
QGAQSGELPWMHEHREPETHHALIDVLQPPGLFSNLPNPSVIMAVCRKNGNAKMHMIFAKYLSRNAKLQILSF